MSWHEITGHKPTAGELEKLKARAAASREYQRVAGWDGTIAAIDAYLDAHSKTNEELQAAIDSLGAEIELLAEQLNVAVKAGDEEAEWRAAQALAVFLDGNGTDKPFAKDVQSRWLAGARLVHRARQEQLEKARKKPRIKKITDKELRDEFEQLKRTRDKDGLRLTKDYAAEVLAEKFDLKFSYVRNRLKKFR